jgi:hypothetical protein
MDRHRVVSDNIQFRSNSDFANLYMPFDAVLFFGDDGGGDQYAYGIWPAESNTGMCTRGSSSMSVQLAAEQTITVGEKVVLEGPSPSQPFGIVFEDDGETAYFYGLDFSKKDNPIVDALHIYNVQQVSDRHTPSQVQLVWSNDGMKAALLINRYPHAIFDFAAKRGYCRTGFPPPAPGGFSKEGHAWDDAAQELFR